MGEQYYRGVLAAFLGTNFFSGPVSEWQIDMIKENIKHYCESQIDHSPLSYQEKEEQKHQMKQSLEVKSRFLEDIEVCKGVMGVSGGVEKISNLCK